MASVFEKALPLVETEEGTDKICLNHDVLNQIRSIKKQINAVAITGLLRTGKSYLLTRLAGRHKGFPLGSSFEPKTKGIWVWCVDHPVRKGQVLMLLDTEGIGDPKKTNRKHDNQLCTLATLLCSTLIYNTFGVLDNDTFQKLSFVTEMSKNVKVSDSANSSDAEFDKYFPDLILVLWDFSLELELNDQECSSDEYLEDAMTAFEGDSEDIKLYNEPRLCIRKYFKSMMCFVFDRPTGRNGLRQLDKLTDADLSKAFVDDTQKFLSYIHNNASPMKLTNGTPVTGSMFAHMATSYVTAIRDGAIPCIESALRYMAINENRKAVEEAFGIYQRGMVFAYPPDDYNTILDAHNLSKDQAFEHFLMHRVLDDDDSYKAKLDDMVLQEYERLKAKLEQDSTARCKDTLITLHEGIAENIKNGVYSNPGGYNVYCSHRDELKRRYDDSAYLGVMKEDAYADFHQQMSTESWAILKRDQHLSEKEKELELFAHMATSYVTAIRDGAIPCIESALRYMAINENRKAVEEAFGIYQRGMVFAYPPDDYNTILDAHNLSKDQAFEHFLMHRVLDDDDSYKAKLDDMVLQEYERLKAKLEQDSTARCKDTLITLHEGIAENIKNGVYSNPGGYNVYCSHRDELKRRYDDSAYLGVMKEDAYADFHQQMSTESWAILKGDQHLSEKEKELERANIERREAIERESILECRLQEFDQELKNMQRQQEKELSKLIKSHANEMQRQREHFDKLSEKREGEIRRLANENPSQLREKHRSEQRAQEEAQRQRDNMINDAVKKMKEQREKDQLEKAPKEKDEAILKERLQKLYQEIENVKRQQEKESNKLVKSHAEEILNERIKKMMENMAELQKQKSWSLWNLLPWFS